MVCVQLLIFVYNFAHMCYSYTVVDIVFGFCIKCFKALYNVCWLCLYFYNFVYNSGSLYTDWGICVPLGGFVYGLGFVYSLYVFVYSLKILYTIVWFCIQLEALCIFWETLSTVLMVLYGSKGVQHRF